MILANFWYFVLVLSFYCSQLFFWWFVFPIQYLDFKHTWWRLFQKRAVVTKFDIYISIQDFDLFTVRNRQVKSTNSWNRKFSLCRLPNYSGLSLDMSHCNRIMVFTVTVYILWSALVFIIYVHEVAAELLKIVGTLGPDRQKTPRPGKPYNRVRPDVR